MEIWGADMGGYHFVISYEDGSQLRPEDRAEWTGYTASFKSLKGRHGQAVRIDGLWKSRAEAERACQAVWRQLRQQH